MYELMQRGNKEREREREREREKERERERGRGEKKNLLRIFYANTSLLFTYQIARLMFLLIQYHMFAMLFF